MGPREEETLIERACRGDPAAVSALLSDQRAGLLRFFELRLDRALGRRLEPEDLVQQTLLEGSARLPEWCRSRAYPLRTWLRLLARQALCEALRHHLGAGRRDARREQEAPAPRGSDPSSLADWVVRSQTSPSQEARRNELREGVRQALEALPELDREILVLRHFESLSNAEAACELDIDPAAASKRFARALGRLRPLLGAFAPEAQGPGARA